MKVGNGAREALDAMAYRCRGVPGLSWADWILAELWARGFKIVPLDAALAPANNIGGFGMHPVATDMIVKEVCQRISEGDCPTIAARSVEQLEFAIEDLAARLGAALAGRPFIHDRTREAQRRLDASVTPEQAADDVRRVREVAAERKRHENMSTAERSREQGDGFINDYD